jgi:hypothetical protein
MVKGLSNLVDSMVTNVAGSLKFSSRNYLMACEFPFVGNIPWGSRKDPKLVDDFTSRRKLDSLFVFELDQVKFFNSF